MSLWNNAIKSLLKMKLPHPQILIFKKKIDEVQYLIFKKYYTSIVLVNKPRFFGK